VASSLDMQLLRKLDRFEIVPRGIHRGGQIGHRRSASRGTGIEFADHKEYSAFGASIASALAYVGLANQDHVRLLLFADGLVSSTRTLAGKTRIYELGGILDEAPEGKTDLREAIESFSKETRLPGVVFILSDFLDPAGVLDGMRLLVSRKFGVYALHLIAPADFVSRRNKSGGLAGSLRRQRVAGHRDGREPQRASAPRHGSAVPGILPGALRRGSQRPATLRRPLRSTLVSRRNEIDSRRTNRSTTSSSTVSPEKESCDRRRTGSRQGSRRAVRPALRRGLLRGREGDGRAAPRHSGRDDRPPG